MLKSGDKKAINLLYEYYADAIYGVILKIISDEEIAQDALQESFVKIWKNSKKIPARIIITDKNTRDRLARGPAKSISGS